MINPKISQNLAIYYLQTELILKQEQVLALFHREQNILFDTFKTSYAKYQTTLKCVENYLIINHLAFDTAQNARGICWQVDYATFGKLNAELPAEMKMIYANQTIEFWTDKVNIYLEISQIPQDLSKLMR
ncbi:MAG: hypothetical protein MUE85_04100 [Microscillaceae bacterium]|jgi:hypothetical protein|nr:hypothetical protein [Microscillaceae bacterium]